MPEYLIGPEEWGPGAGRLFTFIFRWMSTHICMKQFNVVRRHMGGVNMMSTTPDPQHWGGGIPHPWLTPYKKQGVQLTFGNVNLTLYELYFNFILLLINITYLPVPLPTLINRATSSLANVSTATQHREDPDRSTIWTQVFRLISRTSQRGGCNGLNRR